MSDTPYTSALHDALTASYGQRVVELFKTVREVDKDLAMVIKGSVPNAALDESDLDDCAYADKIIAAMRLTHSGRFLKIPALLRTTLASIQGAQTQIEKLNALPASAKPADPFGFVIHNEIERTESGALIIRKRDKPLDPLPDFSPNVLLQENTASRRMGFQQAFRRGKYNDEARLMFNDHGTIEIGEAVPAGSPF